MELNDEARSEVTRVPEKRSLPNGWRWAALAEVCELNPPRPSIVRDPDTLTSFVPMAAVDDRHGIIAQMRDRPYAEVKKGYTYFEEGDVLFAKITPCMQNGKHAIARGLVDGIGFASTEFHVIRPRSNVLAEWVHFFLRQPEVLHAAAASFTGSAGQQRVPPVFLGNLCLPLPPLPEQKRIAAILDEQMAAVERARAAAEAQLEASAELPAACLRRTFDSVATEGWPQRRLGELLHLRKEVVHPYDNPVGHAVFVGLEHIEEGTGKRTGHVDLDLASLTGRKPRFRMGDIVYGYLRPYLNKVWVAEFDGLCSVDQYVYSIDQQEADPQFVALFMRSPAFLARAPVASTPGQLPRIRTEEVASVPIELPPGTEQRGIVAALTDQLDKVTRAQRSLRNQIEAIGAVGRATVRMAFSGAI